MEFKYSQMNTRLDNTCEKLTDTPSLDLQIAIKAMKTQQDIEPNRYDEILQGRKLKEFLNDTWNNVEMTRNRKRPMDTRNISRPSQQKGDGYGPFAAELTQMNLKESNKYMCGSTNNKASLGIMHEE
jgi:hypothetical protein